MIQANELRIGSLVLCSATYDKTPQDYKTVFPVKAIFKGSILIESERRIDIENADPIPLTEEWQRKFEFKKYRWHFIVRDNGYDIDVFDGDKLIYRNGIIKYVHQLQNLFHALTGEELIFKSEAHTASSSDTE